VPRLQALRDCQLDFASLHMKTGKRVMASLLHESSDSKEEAIARRIVLVIVSISVSSMVAGCDVIKPTTTSATPTPATTMTKLTVTGLTALTTLGQTTQLTARAGFSDGSTQDVTNQAAWQSSNTAVATVSPAGLVTSVTFGQADVTAGFQNFSDKVTINLPLDLTGIWRGTGTDMTGSSTFAVGFTQQGSAITGTATITRSNGQPGGGTFSGTVANVGATVTFTIVIPTVTANRTCTLTLNATAQATTTTLTGTYTGSDSCAGSIGGGTMTLTKQ
jgi:hypothetical protein